MRQIKRIFVHCTAGPQTQTIAEIQKYWKNHNKWTNPGYHYIIKPDGEIVPLQPEDKPSNGVAGYNSTSINVCYIGGVDKQGKPLDNRTDAQKEALKVILKDLHSRYPDAEILGHRDIWGSDPKNWHKQCPCFNVKKWWNNVLAEDELAKQEVDEEPKTPIEDSADLEIPENKEEVGPIKEPPTILPKKPEEKYETRPNPLYFVWEFVKLLFKIILRKR